ncbi:hypothetical protein C8R43DRAFT_1140885 [Mycena crocata]|nr:hypothetical protein C8R43DRAFT_1140885 [Mycena crocata]
MPRQGTAARKRARQGLAPVKPGVVGWVHGTKLPFFTGFKQEFLDASEIKETGAFYTRVAHLYIKTYGWHTDWKADLAPGQTVAADAVENEDVDLLLPEVAEWRAKYFAKLRGKIGVWYNGQFGGSVEKKGKPITFRKLFDATALEPPHPARVAARWAVVSRLPNHPKLVTVRNQVTKQAWESETEAFREEVLAALESEHKIAQEAYKVALAADSPSTPAQYDVALNNAGYYLQPFADVLHEHFGMNVVIMLCGPVADRGGRIEEQCRARSLNGMAMADGDLDPNDASTSAPRPDESADAQPSMQARDDEVGPTRPEAEDGESPQDHDGDDQPPRAEDSEPRREERARSNENRAGPVIGKALAAEIAKMAAGERERYLAWLEDLDAELVEIECNLARDRLALRRMEKGILAADAFQMDSDEEEEENGDDVGSQKQQDGVAGPKPRVPEVQPRQQELEVQEDAGRGQRRRRKAADSCTPAPPRPRPTPNWVVRSQYEYPECNRDAEGPLRDPGEAIPGLERPEANREAEGPLPPWQLLWGGESRQQQAVAGGAAVGSTGNAISATGNAERGGTDIEGSGDPVGEEENEWGAENKEGWTEELKNAFEAFSRGKEWGGKEWEDCVRNLVALEKAWGFPNKGMVSAPAGPDIPRPEEVPTFMRAHRKWEVAVKIAGALGPRDDDGSYVTRWWAWWAQIQPAARTAGESWVEPAKVDSEMWRDVGKIHGRNGMLLYVGASLWWGEAAAERDEEESASLLEEWREAVEDVSKVLVEAAKTVGPAVGPIVPKRAKRGSTKKTPAKKTDTKAPSKSAKPTTRASKRKAPDTPEEKENSRPKKRPTRRNS